MTAGPTDRGGSPRRNQEFNHEWPRNQRRAVTSSEPRHPLPPGALPTTAPPLVSYINILFTSIRAAITRSLCAPRCVPKDRERDGASQVAAEKEDSQPEKRRRRREKNRRIRMATASRASHCSHYCGTIVSLSKREIDGDLRGSKARG